MLSEAHKAKLQARLLGVIKQLENLEDEKRETVKSLTEMIKEAKGKVKGLSDTLRTEDPRCLADAYGSDDIETLFS